MGELSEEQAQKIRERLGKATSGPWVADESPVGWYVNYVCDDEAAEDKLCWLATLGWANGMGDAEFIAHAPTDIAALLDDREAKAQRIVELEAFVKRVAREFGPSSADTHWELGDRARAILRGEQQL